MLLDFPRKALILYGTPKSGKTTLTRFLVKTLSPHLKLAGFFTEEVKEEGIRKGFVLKVFAPWIKEMVELPLALRDSTNIKPRVGKYRVFVENLEKALFLLQEKKENIDLWVIDEIGKMEVMSQCFCNFVEELIYQKRPLLATLGVSKQGFLGKVWKLREAIFCEVNKANREFLKKRIVLEFLRKGKLIVIEGIDGSGKSTLCKALFQHFFQKGKNIVISQEPTTGPYGKKIKEALIKKAIHPEKFLELFYLDRLWHVKNVIIPSLEKGDIVLLDRYYLSTLAYQGAQGMDPYEILKKNETIAPLPDFVIFLEISPETALKRVAFRGEAKSCFEKANFLEKVDKIYKKYLPYFNHVILSGEKTFDKVINEALNILESKLESTFS